MNLRYLFTPSPRNANHAVAADVYSRPFPSSLLHKLSAWAETIHRHHKRSLVSFAELASRSKAALILLRSQSYFASDEVGTNPVQVSFFVTCTKITAIPLLPCY